MSGGSSHGGARRAARGGRVRQLSAAWAARCSLPSAPPDSPLPSSPHTHPPPRITTKNPAKLLKKLRNRRLAAVKGVVLSKGKKRAKPLAGANQFHRKVGSKKKR